MSFCHSSAPLSFHFSVSSSFLHLPCIRLTETVLIAPAHLHSMFCRHYQSCMCSGCHIAQMILLHFSLVADSILLAFLSWRYSADLHRFDVQALQKQQQLELPCCWFYHTLNCILLVNYVRERPCQNNTKQEQRKEEKNEGLRGEGNKTKFMLLTLPHHPFVFLAGEHRNRYRPGCAIL